MLIVIYQIFRVDMFLIVSYQIFMMNMLLILRNALVVQITSLFLIAHQRNARTGDLLAEGVLFVSKDVCSVGDVCIMSFTRHFFWRTSAGSVSLSFRRMKIHFPLKNRCSVLSIGWIQS
jgi:hypothetical protein